MGDDEPMQAIPADALMVEEDTDEEQGVDQVYEIHADGDEEAMMELAIALSLQDQVRNILISYFDTQVMICFVLGKCWRCRRWCCSGQRDR